MLQTTRTTNRLLALIVLLLALIAALLAVLALRPSATVEARAQERPEPKVYVSGDLSGVYVLDGRRLYRFRGDLGRPVAVGQWTDD